MKFNIIDKNVGVSNQSKDYIRDKMSRLDRYLVDKDVTARIEISRVNNVYNIEVTIPIKGGSILRAVAKDHTFQQAVLRVIDKISDQIRRVHTLSQVQVKKDQDLNKKYDEALSPDFYVEEYEDFDDEDFEDDLPRIVRTKRFAVKPMSPEEAVLQMEMVGHDFFVFLNAETDEVCVVYKRNDGQYGLIEPQFS